MEVHTGNLNVRVRSNKHLEKERQFNIHWMADIFGVALPPVNELPLIMKNNLLLKKLVQINRQLNNRLC